MRRRSKPSPTKPATNSGTAAEAAISAEPALVTLRFISTDGAFVAGVTRNGAMASAMIRRIFFIGRLYMRALRLKQYILLLRVNRAKNYATERSLCNAQLGMLIAK